MVRWPGDVNTEWQFSGEVELLVVVVGDLWGKWQQFLGEVDFSQVDATNGSAMGAKEFSPMDILPSVLAQLSACISISFSEFTKEKEWLEVIEAIDVAERGREKDPPIERSSPSMLALTGIQLCVHICDHFLASFAENDVSPQVFNLLRRPRY